MPYVPKPDIPGYELIEKIGEGGMGTVWKAVQLSLDRVVAIKVLAEHLSADESYIGRFHREIRAVARLNHPNIVHVFEASQWQGTHFFTMEYVDGRPITRRLLELGRIPEQEALHIALGVARALDYAWQSEHLIHRDIKPDNILVTRDGTIKITDFGLVKRAFVEEDHELSSAGLTVGTPHYISPEQARGAVNVDTRADLYSLGATLYHILTGQVPFQGASNAEIMTKHLTETPISPKQLRASLSDAACAIVQKLLAKNPDERYQTAQDLIGDIERALGAEPAAAPPSAEAPAPDKLTPKIVVACTLAVVVAALFVFLWLLSKRAAPPSTPQPPPSAFDTGTASALLAEAREFADKHPDQFAVTLARLNETMPQLVGTPQAAALRQLIDDVEHRREVAATAKLAELTKQAQAFIDNEEFLQAAAVYETFPDDLKTARVAARLRDAQDSLRASVRQRLMYFGDEFHRLLGEGRRAEAEAVIARIEQIKAPEVAAFAQMLRAELTKPPAPTPAPAPVLPSPPPPADTPQALYEQMFLPDFDQAMKQRRFLQAVTLCDVWLHDATRAAAHAQVREQRHYAETTRQFIATAAAAAPSLVDKTLTLGGHTGVVVAATTESVQHRADDQPLRTFAIEELPADVLVALAIPKQAPTADGELRLGAGLLWFYEGNLAAARAQLDAALRSGVAESVGILKRLDTLEKREREQAAEAAVRKLGGLVERNQWPEAQTALREIRAQFATTKYVKKQAAALDALESKIAAGMRVFDLERRDAQRHNEVLRRMGRVRVVRQDGKGDYKTLRAAFANANHGDGIEIWDGVYEEWGLASGARNLLVYGKSGALPVISASGMQQDGALFEPSSGWVFDNLFFDVRPSETGARAAVLRIGPSAPLQPGNVFGSPEDIQRLTPQLTGKTKAEVKLHDCVLAGDGAALLQESAVALTLEDCVLAKQLRLRLPGDDDCALSVQHCTLVGCSPVLEFGARRDRECTVRFHDNLLLGYFAALSVPWEKRNEAPRTIYFQGDFNVFATPAPSGRLVYPLTRGRDTNPVVEATNRLALYPYDMWAWIFVMDRNSFGLHVERHAMEREQTWRRMDGIFVAPRAGDFRFKPERVLLRGSDGQPVGVRWADWQWEALTRRLRELRMDD